MRAADPRTLIYLAVALCTCLMPRMKSYSYVLMLIPALFVVRDLGRRGVRPNYLLISLAVLVLAQPQQTNVPGMSRVLTLAQAYLPLLLAAAEPPRQSSRPPGA